mmetsp:Transcript_11956/g.17628  ORF Transcript_11956/g.17628 Transcript_11956/m.17628 type:complete len:202 (-) Transcript_11956:83-688(-)
MPPKKKGGKKKKKQDDQGENGGELTDEQKAKLYMATCQSLQMQLAERSEEASKATSMKMQLAGNLEQMQTKYEIEEEKTYAITRDMTRQYKGMQEELLDKINALENTVQSLKDELDRKKQELADSIRQKDQVIEQKDKHIASLEHKMDDMATEFGDMLKETLDKMRERIELNSTNFDADDAIPIQRRMEEFNLASAYTGTA